MKGKHGRHVRTGQPLYDSAAWIKTRQAYMESRNWLCERCGKPASICHHKEYLTTGNLSNPHITLDWNNLECLCHECHNREHEPSRAPTVFNSKGEPVSMRQTAELKEFADAQKAIAAMDF